jgi:hypothetical protein
MSELTRRDLVRLLIGAGVGAIAPFGCRPYALPAGWLEAHPDPTSAAELGAMWLSQQRMAPLPDELLTGLAAPLDPAALGQRGAAVIRGHLQAKHRADFAAGRTVRVSGWVLSVTEVSFYALMSFVEP